MEHIVNISFAIDDSDIAKQIEERLIAHGLAKVEERVKKTLSHTHWDENEKIIEIAYDCTKQFLIDNKEQIIEKASDKLADKLSRRKEVKERIISEVFDE